MASYAGEVVCAEVLDVANWDSDSDHESASIVDDRSAIVTGLAQSSSYLESAARNDRGAIVHNGVIANIAPRAWIRVLRVARRSFAIRKTTMEAECQGVELCQLVAASFRAYVENAYFARRRKVFPEFHNSLRIPDTPSDMPSHWSRFFPSLRTELSGIGISYVSRIWLRIVDKR